MQITSASTAPQSTTQTGSTTNSSTTANSASDLSSTFMQLLIAELKSQNPTSPQDPTQFVGQLAQFNSLSELQSIHAILKTATANLTTAGTTTGSQASQTSSTNGGN